MGATVQPKRSGGRTRGGRSAARFADGGRTPGSRPPLNEESCAAIHAASLELLAVAGVHLDDPAAVALLADAGATVGADERVRIPEDLVDWALSRAPGTVTIHGRDGRPALVLDGSRTYYGPGSDTLNIVDHRSGQRREPLLADVIDGSRLCDRLPNIDFLMSLVVPTDVDRAIADRYQLREMLRASRKPVVVVSYDLGGCLDAVAMAEAVAGGSEELSERPFIACYVNPSTPLHHNRDAVGKLLFLAERGIPMVHAPGCIAGGTGPATVAGSITMTNAGMLVGLVLAQLVREGAPFILKGWGGGGLDMKTAVYGYAGPDSRRAAPFMARYYGLPCFALAGATDAKLVDQQAAAEAALTLAVDTLSGADMMHDLGYMESGLSFSLALLAICDELVGWLRRCGEPVDVSDEALAVRAVETTLDGDYLTAAHTLEHFREMWRPGLLERQSYEGWARSGAATLAERAAARVDDLLDLPAERQIDDSVDERLGEIVTAAEARRQEA